MKSPTTTIRITPGASGFAEDKDDARSIRETSLLPALEKADMVVIDFEAVAYATQSYVHALVGEALKRYGEQALRLIEFKHCSPTVRSVVELVVDYSLGGFPASTGTTKAIEQR